VRIYRATLLIEKGKSVIWTNEVAWRFGDGAAKAPPPPIFNVDDGKLLIPDNLRLIQTVHAVLLSLIFLDGLMVEIKEHVGVSLLEVAESLLLSFHHPRVRRLHTRD